MVAKSSLKQIKRLQRMMLRLQKFDLEVTYKKGAQMYLADTLSRAYLSQTTSEPLDEQVLQVRVRRSSSQVVQDVESVDMASYLSVTEETLALIQQATNADPTMVQLQNIIRQGWPDRKTHVDKSLQDYFPFRDELSLQDGLIFKGERLVIPQGAYILIFKRNYMPATSGYRDASAVPGKCLLAGNDQVAYQFHMSV